MERELIRRAQRGDQEAFRLLVERHAHLAWRTARVLLPNRASAEDAVQEAWVDAWRGLARFDPERPFRPWLVTLVANRCRKAVRRRPPPDIGLDSIDAARLAGPDDALADVLRREDDRALRAALAGLPDDQRRVLDLRFFADLDLAEIALVTDVPLGTVKSRLHRALRAVRLHWPAACLAASGRREEW